MLNVPLEASKLHHGVGDLAAPQRHERLVEAAHALGGVDLGSALAQRRRECPGRRGLDANLRRKTNYVNKSALLDQSPKDRAVQLPLLYLCPPDSQKS